MATRSTGCISRPEPQQGQQRRSTVVVSQSRPSDIATLRIFTKALPGRRDKEQCARYSCCYCPQLPDSNFSTKTSALLIGRSNASDIPCCHVTSLSKHLSQLNVTICNRDAVDYRGSKEKLSSMISDFFTKRTASLYILYYSGPTSDNGDWTFTTTAHGEKVTDVIRLKMITDKWKERTHVNSQLLIIVDGRNGIKWVEKAKKYESSSNISIMASLQHDESAATRAKEGLFTESLLGMHGQEYYPDIVQQKIKKFFDYDPLVDACCICGYP